VEKGGKDEFNPSGPEQIITAFQGQRFERPKEKAEKHYYEGRSK